MNTRYGAGNRTRFAISFPMGKKIMERLGGALAGGAHSRRIWMGSRPVSLTNKKAPHLGYFLLKCFDNNDTVSYGFKRFHSKMKLLNGK